MAIGETFKTIDWRGIRGLVAAEIKSETEEAITYDTPFRVCGVATLTKTTETSSAKKYYDNVPAIVIQATGGDEVNVEGSAIQEHIQAKLMGEYYDDTLGMYVEGEPTTKYFALGYITEDTDGEERYVWRLKGTFSYPEAEHKTKDDGTDSNGSTLVYTGVNTMTKFTKNGNKTAKAVVVKASKYTAGETKFFETVQTPDTVGTTNSQGS